MISQCLFSVGCAVAIVIALLWKRLKPSRLPPGPTGIPILGYWPFLPRDVPIPRFLTQMSKKYGAIYSIKIGSRDLVVLNTHEAIEKAFMQNSFSGRAPWPSVKTFVHGGQNSITFVDGPVWRFNRKLAVRAVAHLLRANDGSIQEATQKSLSWLLGILNASGGKPVGPYDVMFPCTGAIVAALSFGVEPTPDGKLFQRLVGIIEKVRTPATGIVEFHEYLSPIFHFSTQRFMNGIKEVTRYVCDHAEKNIAKNEVPEVVDLATAVEWEIQKTPADDKDTLGLTDADMRRMLADMFQAGFFTSAENMVWGLLHMALNKNAQDKLADELSTVLGKKQMADLDDLPSLDYTRATMYEIYRYGSSTAILLPHQTVTDVDFMGYHLPKGTEVVGNAFAVHFNPETFPDPYEFRPERFLDESGFFSDVEASKVILFGVGKRKCVGEPIATRMLPLMLATIIHNFDVAMEPGAKMDPFVDVNFMLTIQPKPHNLVFTPRA